MLPTVDHLSELSSPVADMIICNHVVSDESGNLRQCIPQNRRADVPDVHRFRNIRRAEVDDDGFRLCRPLHAKALIQSKFQEAMSEKFRRKPEINESWTGDFSRFPDIVHR